MSKKKKKLPYWQRRGVQQDITVHKNLDSKENIITNAYLKAQDYLSKEVSKLYKRYVNKSGKSAEEVKKILNTYVDPAKLVELKNLSKSIKDTDTRNEVKNYLTGLAVKGRITRLEDLKAKSFIVTKQIADIQLRTSTNYYVEVIHDAYNQAAADGVMRATDKSIRDGVEIVDWQTGQPIKNTDISSLEPVYKSDGSNPKIEIVDWKNNKTVHIIDLKRNKPVIEFKELSTKYVRNILETEWNGSNYSNRIWNDTDFLAKKLEELFAAEAMSGMSEQDMSKELANKFGTSINVARRLVRTEANYVAGQAKLKGWLEHGIEEYKLVVVLDLRTSSICQKKSLLDKVYKVKDAIVNGADGNYPPFHPWCRTIAIAYFGKQSLQGSRIANDPVTGQTFNIQMDTTYKQWEEMLIERNSVKELDLMKIKVRNFHYDLKQYRRYKDILGENNLPESFDKFQEIKYTDSKNWGMIQQQFKRQSGALTSKNDPNLVKRFEHADKYYKSVKTRDRSSEIRTVSKNTGFNENYISKVYNHMFVNKYKLNSGYKTFDPDYDMSQSWQRLRLGRDIKPHDLTMLRHERLEYQLMNKHNYYYEDAHTLTVKKYDYQKELDTYLIDNNLI